MGKKKGGKGGRQSHGNGKYSRGNGRAAPKQFVPQKTMFANRPPPDYSYDSGALNPQQRLRNSKVAFVPSSQPQQADKPLGFEMDKGHLKDDASERQEGQEVAAANAHTHQRRASQQAFTARLPEPHKADSSVSEDEDDMVVVFRGRNNAASTKETSRQASPTEPSAVVDEVSKTDSAMKDLHVSATIDNGDEVVHTEQNKQDLGNGDVEITKTVEHVSDDGYESVAEEARVLLKQQDAAAKKNGRQRQSKSQRFMQEMFDDYAENLRANGLIGPLSTTESPAEPREGANEDGSDGLEDFADYSTSEGELERIDRVMDSRQRKSGLQFLVIGDGDTTHDARWMLASHIRALDNGQKCIEGFERRKKGETASDWTDEDDEEDSEDEEDPNTAVFEGEVMYGSNSQDSDEFMDDEDYDEEMLQREIAKMDDETVARLLAKQEELGLGSNELVLFDGEGVDMDDDSQAYFQDMYGPNRGAKAKKSKPTKEKKNKKKQPQRAFQGPLEIEDIDFEGIFDDDDALVGGFDFMDRERASVSWAQSTGKKNKGKKMPMINLSDSEEEAHMQKMWEADRAKKKARKDERELLRQEGLLGKKSKKKQVKKQREDFDHMLTADKFESLFGRFLENDDVETLPLPPMDKAQRRTVHEVARAFGVKSVSHGKQRSRFTELIKTPRSLEFLESSVMRRFRGRLRGVFGGSRPNNQDLDDDWFEDPRPKSNRSKKRAGGDGKATYRDGDVVGSHAPEISSANRGRAMLEKMGWSKGMALGRALEDEIIDGTDNSEMRDSISGEKDGEKEMQRLLQPIAHVVKTTRAGLGGRTGSRF